MKNYIKICLNSKKDPINIALPIDFDQLKAEFKKAYDLTQNQLSNLKIYYSESNKKNYLENNSSYESFILKNDIKLIEAEISIEEKKEDNKIIDIPNDSNLKIDNRKTLRCCEKNCYLNPSINIIKDDNSNFMINYHCRNNHKKENMPIKEFLSLSNKELKDICCNYCSLNKDKNKDIIIYHCYKCQKYICNLDKKKHSNECDNSILIEIEKIDLVCNIHGKKLSYFCNDCKISFCVMCKEHQNHNKNYIDELKFEEFEKKILLNEINKNLNDLDIIYNEIKNVLMKKITDIYVMNKNLLELNKILLDNLNNKELIGEINGNAIKAFFMKTNKIEKTLSYYKDSFDILENYFKDEFYEFNIEKQKKLLQNRRGIPIEVSYGEDTLSIFSYYTTKKNLGRKIVPPDATISFISYYLRRVFKPLPTDIHADMLILDENDKEVNVPGEITLSEVYKKYKRNDGILYFYFLPAPVWG